MAKNEKLYLKEEGKKVIEGGSVGSVTITPGESVTIKAGTVIGGNTVNNDQSFTNNDDSTMKLAYNEENDIFELQPIGEVEYLN